MRRLNIEIAEIEARLAVLTGLCGDHSCVFGPPKGLGTNGGCRCEVKRNPKVQQAIQLQRKLSALLRERVETQAESITTFQSQFRVMKEAIEAALTWIEKFKTLDHNAFHGAKQGFEWQKCNERTCQKAVTLVEQLRSAITPKGSEQ